MCAAGYESSISYIEIDGTGWRGHHYISITIVGAPSIADRL